MSLFYLRGNFNFFHWCCWSLILTIIGKVMFLHQWRYSSHIFSNNKNNNINIVKKVYTFKYDYGKNTWSTPQPIRNAWTTLINLNKSRYGLNKLQEINCTHSSQASVELTKFKAITLLYFLLVIYYSVSLY